MKSADTATHYHATKGTFIKVVDLGQIIALSKRNLQWAAKPSEVFLNRENHDRIFDRTIPKYAQDIVFTSNLMKAMKRGLNNYLELPTHVNSYAPIIFRKPIVRTHVYYLALLYYYQNDNKRAVRIDFSRTLNKIANPRLVDELQSFYQRVVTKIKNWYTDESKKLAVEISKRRTDAFFAGLATELGVDTTEGAIPFSSASIWE